MATDADLERQIDALYQRPLPEFTAARNALAKSLPRADAARIKSLQKPTVLPWLVNQVYWQARSIYDRLIAAGTALRRAQVGALEKPGATPARAQQVRDGVREATDAHRQAVADAVHQAVRLAGQHGLTPSADALTRMLEALSLSAQPPDPPGRLTDVVQPAGFEALFGVALSPPTARGDRGQRPSPPAAPARPSARVLTAVRPPSTRESDAAARAERARRAALERAHREADAALASARDAERTATHERRQAAQAVKEAEAALARAQRALQAATDAADRASRRRAEAEERLRGLTRPQE